MRISLARTAIAVRPLVLAALVAVFGLARPADASFLMTIEDPFAIGSEIIMIDGQGAGAVSDDGTVSNVADPDGIVNGVMEYSGTIGAFSLTVTTGLSKPAIGPARIDLNNVSLTSIGAGGTLLIDITDTGFATIPAEEPIVLLNQFGGVTDGAIQAQGFLGQTNLEFEMSIATPLQLHGPGPFNSDVFTPTIGTGGAYSLTEKIEIVHSAGSQTTSFNKVVSVVPEPGTFVLVALGLFGLAFGGRQRL